jgi:hypothetical protein
MADSGGVDASEATVNSRYIPVLRRMYEHPSAQPWSVESIRDALEPMSPLAQNRRQIVPFLRDLAGRLWCPVGSGAGQERQPRQEDHPSGKG